MAPPATSKVVVIDDHALFSLAVAVALEVGGRHVEALDVDGSDVDGEGALVIEALEHEPDIALVDLDLGTHGDGRKLIRPLTRAGVDVVVVSALPDPDDRDRCLRKGARAVLRKDRPLEELVALVERLEQERRPVPDD